MLTTRKALERMRAAQEGAGAKEPLPSLSLLSRFLGLFRVGGTVELPMREIACLVGCKRRMAHHIQRWLGATVVMSDGKRVAGAGLLVANGRRGRMTFERRWPGGKVTTETFEGKRTSERGLTSEGCKVLDIALARHERQQHQQRQFEALRDAVARDMSIASRSARPRTLPAKTCVPLPKPKIVEKPPTERIAELQQKLAAADPSDKSFVEALLRAEYRGLGQPP